MGKITRKILLTLCSFALVLSVVCGLGAINNTAKAATVTQTYDTSVIAFGDPALAEDADATSRIWFVLSNHDYTQATDIGSPGINDLNWGSKIRITIDGVEKTMAEWGGGTIKGATAALFAREFNPIGVQIDGIPDNRVIEKVVIEAGCQFPSQATAGSGVEELTAYVTTQETTFVKDGNVFKAYNDTEVTAFGDPNGVGNAAKDHLWFTLSNKDYIDGDDGFNRPVRVEQRTNINFANKIKVTIGGVEKYLSEYSISDIILNRWARAGRPVGVISAIADYTTIEKVVIEAGCEFPSHATYNSKSGVTLYRTTETVTFINDGNGNFVLPNTYIDTAVTSFGDPGKEVFDALWFTLSTNDYEEYNTEILNPQLSALNCMDKISFVIGEETKTLRDLTPDVAWLHRFARGGRPIAFRTTLADYKTIKSVTIEAGCEFPSQATKDKNKTSGLTLYRTTEDVTFVNDGNGNFVLPNTYLDTAVTSFGDPSNDPSADPRSQLWFVLSNHDYTEYNMGVNATQIANINFANKIKLTIGGVEKSLSEYTISVVRLALWARGGNPIGVDAGIADWTQIEKVVIEAGCEFPSQATREATTGLTLYRTTEEVTFVNVNGQFIKYVPNTYLDTEVIAFGDPDAANRCVDHMWFTLSNHDYNEANKPVENPQLSTSFNWTEKITFVIGGEEKSLGDYDLSLAWLCKYARLGNPLGLETSLLDYTAIESITIAAGCEFPSYASSVDKNQIFGLTVYRTTKAVTFYNDGTGAFLTLDQIKANAKAELAAYKNADDYRANEQAILATVLTTANGEIDACGEPTAIAEIVAEAKEELDAIKTDAEYDAEENAAALAQAKENAKAELAAYKNADDYRTAEQVEIAGILAAASNDIDACETTDAIAVVVADVKADLDAVKTDAQLTEAENAAAAALAQAKEDAKAELAAYKNAEDYRTAEQTQMATILADANDAIDACEDEAAIAEAVAEAKDALDALKTDAEYTEEENAGNEESGSTSEEESKDDGEAAVGCMGTVDGASAGLLVLALAGAAIVIKKRKN